MEYAAEKAIEAVGGFIKGKIPETSNPNLLINPNFKINQRYTLGTFSDTGKYFVDRWRLETGTVTVNSDNTITLNGTICQPLENAVGSNVTASVSAGTAVYDDSTKIFTITGKDVNISWVKLEIGNTATAFSPPDYALELLKCQRYYLNFNPYQRYPSAYYSNAKMTHTFIIPIPAPMRKNPSIEGIRICSGKTPTTSGIIADTSLSVVGSTSNSTVIIRVTLDTGYDNLLIGIFGDTTRGFFDAEIY